MKIDLDSTLTKTDYFLVQNTICGLRHSRHSRLKQICGKMLGHLEADICSQYFL